MYPLCLIPPQERSFPGLCRVGGMGGADNSECGRCRERPTPPCHQAAPPLLGQDRAHVIETLAAHSVCNQADASRFIIN